MIERYAVLAARIRQELASVQHVVGCAERAVEAARSRPEDRDLYMDSAALSLHDFYAGLERIFRQVAATLDQSVPPGPHWLRELLRQMTVSLRPVLQQVTLELRAFADFLDKLAQEGQ